MEIQLTMKPSWNLLAQFCFPLTYFIRFMFVWFSLLLFLWKNSQSYNLACTGWQWFCFLFVTFLQHQFFLSNLKVWVILQSVIAKLIVATNWNFIKKKIIELGCGPIRQIKKRSMHGRQNIFYDHFSFQHLHVKQENSWISILRDVQSVLQAQYLSVIQSFIPTFENCQKNLRPMGMQYQRRSFAKSMNFSSDLKAILNWEV